MASQPIISEVFDTFADDLLAERGPRPLIIIGAPKVDELLLEILRSYLLPKGVKPKEQDELLEGDSPLGTFSSRIKMCRRLGLIDAKLCTALDRLRVLRNSSAHHVAFDHSKSPAREHIGELRNHIVGRGSYSLTRKRYFESSSLKAVEELQCLLLTVCVLLEATRAGIKRTSGNKKSLRISRR